MIALPMVNENAPMNTSFSISLYTPPSTTSCSLYIIQVKDLVLLEGKDFSSGDVKSQEYPSLRDELKHLLKGGRK